jgi:uncharacterized protein YndB with AHSA1/START domain
MQSLDVKFVVHYGEFIRQKMSGREELAGRDVILVHRLLKNDVGKTLGSRAYALYSDACLQAMGIDRVAQGLQEHSEAIEHIGETKCWVSDLEAAWMRESETARSLAQRAGAYLVIEWEFAAPRQAVWDFVTSPQHHARWQRSDGVVQNAARGRRGAGTQNHCLHGKDAVIEDIIDWRPFDYVTLTALLPIPGAPKILFSYVFEDGNGGGTHFEFRVAMPKPNDLPFYERVTSTVEANFTAGFDILRTMVAERATASTVEDEPPLPISRERFVTQPLHASSHHLTRVNPSALQSSLPTP